MNTGLTLANQYGRTGILERSSNETVAIICRSTKNILPIFCIPKWKNHAGRTAITPEAK